MNTSLVTSEKHLEPHDSAPYHDKHRTRGQHEKKEQVVAGVSVIEREELQGQIRTK